MKKGVLPKKMEDGEMGFLCAVIKGDDDGDDDGTKLFDGWSDRPVLSPPSYSYKNIQFDAYGIR